MSIQDMIKRGMIGQKKAYWKKMQQLFGSNLIAAHRADFLSGNTVLDFSGHGCDAVKTNATQTQYGKYKILDFTVANSRMILGSTAFNSVFNGNTGGINILFKYPNVSYFTDAAEKDLFHFRVDDNNEFRCYSLGSNGLFRFYGKRGGVGINYWFIMDDTDFHVLTITWNTTQIKLMMDGGLTTAVGANAGTWTGNLNPEITMLGSYYKYSPFNQCFAYWQCDGITNREITLAEHIALCRASREYGPGGVRFTFIGDSITANYGWAYQLAYRYKGGMNVINNRAIGGSTIMDNVGTPDADMTSQVLAAVNDNANYIYILMGTNDNNAGDMNALQTMYASNIAALKISNPSATIIAINVLKRWTDNTGVTEVDKSNIRTAIAAACTAQGITCMTVTLTAANTYDGLHPNWKGDYEIQTPVLAALP